MNAIHFSDNTLNLPFQLLCDKPEILVKKVKNFHNTVDLFIINVNYRSDSISRTDNAGIKLLKYLRLHHLNQHSILYSFLSRDQLMMQNPHNSIIFSEGVTFIRMPRDLSVIKYDELVNNKAPDNLSEYFRGEINLEQIRHNLANTYGLLFMFNIQNTFFPDEKFDESIFPSEFYQKLDFLQLDIAKYLINFKNENKSEKDTIEQINRLKTEIRNKNPKILYIDDKAELGWSAFLKNAIYGNKISNNFESIAPAKNVFDTKRTLNTFFVKIKEKILNIGNFIDCLLLDLRLADETGDIDDLDMLSGIRLLKRIHQSFPSLPVIIFTASNKAKSVKKIIECGAEALWSKPGLDGLKNDQYYLESYHELLTYLNEALNKYKSDTEKFIVQAQFHVENIKLATSFPVNFPAVNIILTDTSFWCRQDKQIVENHKSIRRILNVAPNIRKRFVVIDDVLKELFIHTKRSNKNTDLKKSAQYSLDTILKYLEKNWIGIDHQTVEAAIKHSTVFSVGETENKKFQVVSNVTKIHSTFSNKQDAYTECKNRNNKYKTSLHADDTFQILIPYYLEAGNNILFISDDFRSWPGIINSININQMIPNSFLKNKIFEVKGYRQSCFFATSEAFCKIWR